MVTGSDPALGTTLRCMKLTYGGGFNPPQGERCFLHGAISGVHSPGHPLTWDTSQCDFKPKWRVTDGRAVHGSHMAAPLYPAGHPDTRDLLSKHLCCITQLFGVGVWSGGGYGQQWHSLASFHVWAGGLCPTILRLRLTCHLMNIAKHEASVFASGLEGGLSLSIASCRIFIANRLRAFSWIPFPSFWKKPQNLLWS